MTLQKHLWRANILPPEGNKQGNIQSCCGKAGERSTEVLYLKTNSSLKVSHSSPAWIIISFLSESKFHYSSLSHQAGYYYLNNYASSWQQLVEAAPVLTTLYCFISVYLSLEHKSFQMVTSSICCGTNMDSFPFGVIQCVLKRGYTM